MLILRDTIAQQINSNPNAGWEAGVNSRFSNYTVSQFKYLLGVKPKTAASRNDLLDIPIVSHPKNLKLPKEFDARTAWPQCNTIGKILDQGHCGFCWAVAAAEALSDRFCVNLGLCDPSFDAIGCSHPGCEPGFPTPKCVKQCKDKNQIWKQSKHFSVNAYQVSSNPTDIMAEVCKNGPVEVAFTVYEDFDHYKSSVYKHIAGDVMGGHAVKLIGWGTTKDGEDYWLLANQWNKSWGMTVTSKSGEVQMNVELKRMWLLTCSSSRLYIKISDECVTRRGIGENIYKMAQHLQNPH